MMPDKTIYNNLRYDCLSHQKPSNYIAERVIIHKTFSYAIRASCS